jgi:hypothetical protein
MKVAFAHNVFNRFKMLKETIEVERKIFPDSKISVACNGDFINIFNEFNDIQFTQFNERPHKIGCVNGCILSIQQLLSIDFDVLIFSHDDVYVVENNLNVIEKHIESIINGEFDVVCRKPLKYVNNTEVFGGYYMMEVFYVSKNTAVKLFTDIKTLKDEYEMPIFGTPSPEVWFYQLINGKELKINEIQFLLNENYNNNLMNQMGFYHKNAGIRGWRD